MSWAFSSESICYQWRYKTSGVKLISTTYSFLHPCFFRLVLRMKWDSQSFPSAPRTKCLQLRRRYSSDELQSLRCVNLCGGSYTPGFTEDLCNLSLHPISFLHFKAFLKYNSNSWFIIQTPMCWVTSPELNTYNESIHVIWKIQLPQPSLWPRRLETDGAASICKGLRQIIWSDHFSKWHQHMWKSSR